MHRASLIVVKKPEFSQDQKPIDENLLANIRSDIESLSGQSRLAPELAKQVARLERDLEKKLKRVHSNLKHRVQTT